MSKKNKRKHEEPKCLIPYTISNYTDEELDAEYEEMRPMLEESARRSEDKWTKMTKEERDEKMEYCQHFFNVCQSLYGL